MKRIEGLDAAHPEFMTRVPGSKEDTVSRGESRPETEGPAARRRNRRCVYLESSRSSAMIRFFTPIFGLASVAAR
jgi:hypothetical protein